MVIMSKDVNRMKHSLGVARKMKELALKRQPKNLKFAEEMYTLGLLHDIGYEFDAGPKGHAVAGGEILKRTGYKYWREVSNHGSAENKHKSLAMDFF